MITRTYYAIGHTDEADETFELSFIEQGFKTYEEAEQYLKEFIKKNKYMEWRRKDFDIAKVIIVIERETDN
jgi:hypothetical protein